MKKFLLPILFALSACGSTYEVKMIEPCLKSSLTHTNECETRVVRYVCRFSTTYLFTHDGDIAVVDTLEEANKICAEARKK